MDVDASSAAGAYLVCRRGAAGQRRPGLRRQRRYAVLGGGVRGSGERGEECAGRDQRGERAQRRSRIHAGRLTAMIRSVSRIFVTRALPFPALDRLKAEHDVEVWPETAPPEPAALRRRLGEVEGLLTMLTERVDEELLDAAPRLRAIANMAVGTDNIDLAAARARGIAVGATPGVLTDTTADLAVALLLGAARRLREGECEVREGRWAPWQPAHGLGADVSGATLGIVGRGRIGEA